MSDLGTHNLQRRFNDFYVDNNYLRDKRTPFKAQTVKRPPARVNWALR
jgi:hypothetical protein